MNTLIAIILIILSIPFTGEKKKTTAPAKSPRVEKIINSQWTFNYFPDEKADKGYEAPGYIDTRWPAVSIPHTWSTYETTGDVHPFIKDASENDNPYWWTGWGWYRKHFIINDIPQGQKVFIEFEGVQKYCKIWINGKYLGDHKGGYGSFDFDVTNYITPAKDNLIAVAVNNRQKDEFKIPPMAAGSFNVYGGIYRDVRIVIKDKLYIPMQGSASHEGGTFVTTPEVSEKEGVVRVQTWVKNDYSQPKNCVLSTYIMDASRKVVEVLKSKFTINPGQLYKFDQVSAPVKNPHLWSNDNPYMYNVISEVTDGSKVTDSYTSPLGFRWFRWESKENFLYVNDKKMVIHGGNRHQEYPWLGDAIPKWITLMDYTDMAENLKYNFMRTAHYPNDKYVYELADKFGIIIDEEFPGIKNQTFSVEEQEQQMKEMIRRDRNHPSIMFWSMGNETNRAVDSKFAISEDTTRILTARLVPDQSNFHSVIFKDVLIEKGNITAIAAKDGKTVTSEVIMAGEPSRIILKGSHQKIKADRGSVAIITADIVDLQGVHIYGASNTIKWTVTGPATLAAPSVYESDINKHHEMNGVWYMDMPVSNVIRSTGKPGNIHITVFSSGLASGSFDIEAEELITDNSKIAEPVLENEGREPVDRPTMNFYRLEEIPQEIKPTSDEFNLGLRDKQSYVKVIRDYILKNNPVTDSTAVEFKVLLRLFSSHLLNNNGRLVADDYNFNTDHYNNCRLISGYINATKLPPLFKETLKKFYADAIIRQGSEKNAGDEMNWLNWIPSGGTVVISQDGTTPIWPKGTIITSKTELTDLIAVVYPVFIKYSDEAKERAITFISKMNPYITVKEVSEQSREGDKKKIITVSYTAEKGKPILIPLIKFISE